MYSPKQAEVIREARSRLNFLVGAISSGKTFIGSDLLVLRIGSLPPGNILLTGKTLDTYQRNVLDPMRNRFGDDYISTIHGSPLHVDIFGRPCYVVGANDERSYRKIQGISLVHANCDELTGFPESFTMWLMGRLREPGAILDATMNPEHPSHYVKRMFVDRTDLDLSVFNFTIDDNPFLDPIYVAEMKRIYTGVWYDRLILGKWVAAQGAVYDMFDERVHVVDFIPQILRYWVSCDYGTSNPTAFLLIGLGVDGKYYVIDEFYWDSVAEHRQLTDAEYSQKYQDWIQGWGVTPMKVLVDPSAASFKVQLRKDRIPNVIDADNDVLNGIRRVSTMFNKSRLFIHKRCTYTRTEVSSYLWDPKASLKGEDKPKKESDHTPDALRYLINHVTSGKEIPTAAGGERPVLQVR